jgi:hypothetical protein
MSAVSGGGNYISDSQVMAWLAEQQNRIYGELGENMDLADDRADFVEALSKIKSDLHGAKSNEGIKKVDEELQAFITKYGSDPRFAEDMAGLDDIAARVNADAKATVAPPPPPLSPEDKANPGSSAQSPTPGVKGGNLQAPPGTHYAGTGPHGEIRWEHDTTKTFTGYSDDDLKAWDDLIGSKTDHANKNDQLTMIHIQELRSTLDQGSQLASSFISSGDKTSSAIINNIA